MESSILLKIERLIALLAQEEETLKTGLIKTHKTILMHLDIRIA